MGPPRSRGPFPRKLTAPKVRCSREGPREACSCQVLRDRLRERAGDSREGGRAQRWPRGSEPPAPASTVRAAGRKPGLRLVPHFPEPCTDGSPRDSVKAERGTGRLLESCKSRPGRGVEEKSTGWDVLSPKGRVPATSCEAAWGWEVTKTWAWPPESGVRRVAVVRSLVTAHALPPTGSWERVCALQDGFVGVPTSSQPQGWPQAVTAGTVRYR